MIAVEHGWRVTWSVGSANLTASAFTGSNVEMMASVTGKKGGAGGRGIGHFLDGGFLKLCVPYRRVEQEAEDPRVSDARARLEAARDALVGAGLRVVCASGDDLWTLTIDGGVVVSAVWRRGRPWASSRRRLPVARLTVIHRELGRASPMRGVGARQGRRMTLRLPAEGMPADRMHHVLRGLLDSPEKFHRFLRALLGGLDQLSGWLSDEGKGDGPVPWGDGLGGETLLDDLVRTASRDPDRLKPVRRLIDDLRKTGRAPHSAADELFAVLAAIPRRRWHRSHVHEATIRRGELPLKRSSGRTVEHACHRLFVGGGRHRALPRGARSRYSMPRVKTLHRRARASSPAPSITSGTTSAGSTSSTSAATAASRAPISPSCRWAGRSSGRSRWRPAW